MQLLKKKTIQLYQIQLLKKKLIEGGRQEISLFLTLSNPDDQPYEYFLEKKILRREKKIHLFIMSFRLTGP